ncbi:NAD-specific glutamate dehydrogenase [Trachymyrmex zeteki]|uniref:NAD-specific glutamate dehydrogenase n=1 Tax=Mycetomoellerius zeteki TaxID=64791 RepID=A0A151XFQ2_9HYME|nr:NAD-specific glutamate dehydrogenase [Trachymyrmex zeteki]
MVNSQYRYVESTTVEIEDQNVPFTTILFVESVSDGGCGRLVNDPQDVQSGDSARVLRSLTLRVVEVYRYRDHSGRIQVSFLHPGQNHRGNLFAGKKDFASPTECRVSSFKRCYPPLRFLQSP